MLARADDHLPYRDALGACEGLAQQRVCLDAGGLGRQVVGGIEVLGRNIVCADGA